MTEHLTATQIQSRLERAVAHHPDCAGFRIEVTVRRLEDKLRFAGAWSADFHALGTMRGRDACKTALHGILSRAQEDYALRLDS